MRSVRVLFTGIILAAMVAALAAPALAGRSSNAVGAGSPIVTDPNMPGTKYEGPLGILYFPESATTVSMYFTLRLRHGNDISGFAGSASGIHYQVVEEVQAAITDFINTDVIPYLYFDDDAFLPCGAPGAMMCPAWAVKSVDQVVSDDCLGGGCQLFDILDVVIAVQD